MAHGRGRSRLQTHKEGQAEGRRVGNVNESGKGVTEVQQEGTRESQWMGNGGAREKLAQIHRQIGAKCALNPGGSV